MVADINRGAFLRILYQIAGHVAPGEQVRNIIQPSLVREAREDPLLSAIGCLVEEIGRARAKHPGNARLFEALVEEVCEGANDHRDGASGNPEWLQVACVAMRMYTEGAPGIDESALRMRIGSMERHVRDSGSSGDRRGDRPYRCVGCRRAASEIPECRAMTRGEDSPYASADDAVESEEGTFNPTHGTFWCDTCYVRAGQPLGLAPALPVEVVERVEFVAVDLSGEPSRSVAAVVAVDGQGEVVKVEPVVRSCNRHVDCNEADRRVREQGVYLWADHCNDEDCEDCHGR